MDERTDISGDVVQKIDIAPWSNTSMQFIDVGRSIQSINDALIHATMVSDQGNQGDAVHYVAIAISASKSLTKALEVLCKRIEFWIPEEEKRK